MDVSWTPRTAEDLLLQVVHELSDHSSAVPASEFPHDRDLGNAAGMYEWWVDEGGRASLARVFADPVGTLVYAGQAGATSTRSQRPSKSTLGSRIRRNHVRGNIYGSTMRRTFAAILVDELDLELAGRRRLTPASEQRLSGWIARHLRVAAVAIEDRTAIGSIEPLVLRELDPEFNLDHVSPSTNRTRLRALRAKLDVFP